MYSIWVSQTLNHSFCFLCVSGRNITVVHNASFVRTGREAMRIRTGCECRGRGGGVAFAGNFGFCLGLFCWMIWAVVAPK